MVNDKIKPDMGFSQRQDVEGDIFSVQQKTELVRENFNAHRDSNSNRYFYLHNIHNIFSSLRKFISRRYKNWENNRISERQLEVSYPVNSAIVLPDNQESDSQNDKRPVWNRVQYRAKREIRRTPSRQSYWEGDDVVVPTLTLPKNKHIKIRLRPGKQGWIKYKVEAEHPVSTFVFSDEDLPEFYAGEGRQFSEGGFTRRKKHEEILNLDENTTWHLIIMNDGPHDVAVHYGVYI